MHHGQSYTEDELIQGLRARREQAFSFLYDCYSRALVNIIMQFIPRQEGAEDVLQDVFLKIWQNIHTYDAAKGRLFTWMLNIARNTAIDRTRSKDFNRQAKTKELTEDVYKDEPGVHSKVDDAGLRKVMERLPKENRKLLELSYYQGYTQEEIATMLGIPWAR